MQPRLGLVNIKPGRRDVTGAQRGDQRGVVHQRAAGGVGDDGAGRRVVDGAALAAFARERAADPSPSPAVGPIVGASARNRFTGLVTRVVTDAVMAQVELQAGPHRVVSLLSREAVEELGLEPGVLAVASVKATSVVLEVPGRPG